MRFIPHVIDGHEQPSEDGAVFPTVDPWRQQAWGEVARGGAREVQLAVEAARRAFDEGPWPRMGFEERGRILHRFADLVTERCEDFARADTIDMGKPLRVMRAVDVPRAARNLRFFADHARLRTSEALPMDSGHHAYVRYEPAGVVAAIAPWNFPLMLATWKIAPPLAWGNTVVLKPAEDAPASASLLAGAALDAGLPPGVLNVVHGFGAGGAGEALTRSPGVDRITFTGESATGRAIATAAAANLTPVSLELGGKGANIVFADADLDAAVRWSAEAIFSNSGQVCLSGSRLYVERAVYEEFLRRFVAHAGGLTLGDPGDPGTDLGPLSSEAHWRKVTGYLERVGEDGGEIVSGGPGPGWSVRPTVVTGAPPSAPICREEVFGPVVVVTPFDDEDEAVRLANDTPYGLSAMLFTEDVRRAYRVAAALRSGMVWVNCFYVRDLRAPFGGVGASGIGREGGDHSREFCTEPKAVILEI